MSFEELKSSENDLTFSNLQKRLKKVKGVLNLSDDVLRTLELKKGDDYTNAGVLFSDDNMLDASNVNLIAYKDETVKQIIDREIVNGVSILEQYELCIQFYKKHITKVMPVEICSTDGF